MGVWRFSLCFGIAFLGELGFTRGAHLLKILTGTIAGAGERTRRHLKETLGSRDGCIGAEGLRRHEINHLGMARRRLKKNGSASCRERVGQDVLIWGVAVPLKKNKKRHKR